MKTFFCPATKLPRIAFLAILVLASALAPAFAGFKCDGESNSCHCMGTDECKDMRKSGMCKDELDCGYDGTEVLVCNCTAARILSPGGVRDVKPQTPRKPKLPRQSPTAPSGTQQ